MSESSDPRRPSPRAGRGETMAGLAKGLRIIEVFDGDHTELTVSTAAALTGITPAAARRCLLTLQELGYVSHDGKFFRPTPRMQRLGGSYSNTAPLSVLAQPHLAAVRDELGEPTSLAVLDGDHVVFVARVESQRVVTANVRLGGTLPAHASATGRLLLSALSDEEIDHRLRECAPERTGPRTVTDVAELRRLVSDAGRTGVSLTDEELETGVRTVAVPVIDATGRTHAALSLAVLAHRTTVDELRERYVPVMRREADGLGRKL